MIRALATLGCLAAAASAQQAAPSAEAPAASFELVARWSAPCDGDAWPGSAEIGARPYFSGSETSARALLERARAGSCADGGQPIDLERYWRYAARSASERERWLACLRADPRVDFAYAADEPAPPPGDILPPTPSFHARQLHLDAAPNGIGAADGSRILGASGALRRLVDLEWSWHRTHEDIAALAAAPALGAPAAAALFTDHGTAAVGLICADPDAPGMRGIAPDVALALASANTASGYSVAHAVLAAQAFLRAGDVLLLEVQARSPLGFVPAEYVPADFDAIRNLVAAGVVVIEPAGNGGVDLDDPFFAGLFDRAQRDSGAIVVAASDGVPPQRSSASSFGSRVDVNAFGLRVASTGFGDLFNPVPTPEQRYTATFGGTSAAAAMAAGIALQVLGAAEAQAIPFGLPRIGPLQLRDLLRRTGVPPATARELQQIGRRLDAAEALQTLHLWRGLNLLDDARPGASIRVELAPRELGFAADAWALFGALHTQPIPLPSATAHCGRWLLAPAHFFSLGAGALGTGSGPVLSFAIPPDPSLRGLRVALQALYLQSATGALCASSASVIYVIG